MSDEILDKPLIVLDRAEHESESGDRVMAYLPSLFAIAGSIVLLGARILFGGTGFISDGALMILALACYLIAAVFYITNIYAPTRIAELLGLYGATFGVFFNLSSWLVRWVAAYDREFEIFTSQGRDLSEMPWIWRYIPFANLYDLSVAFAFGAGIVTLLVIRREHFRVVAPLSLSLAAIILVLARFIGGEFLDLPPVLDSYWRPIHVGVASLSYGIALVCFAVAVLYLLKDGLKTQAMAVWTSIFAFSVLATISKFSVFSYATFGTYTASTYMSDPRATLALRANIPYVGWMMVVCGILLVSIVIVSSLYLSKKSKLLSKFSLGLLIATLAVQALTIGTLVYQIKNAGAVQALIGSHQYETFAVWMLQQQDVPQAQIDAMRPEQLAEIGGSWVQQNGSRLKLSLQSNPVELAALITAFAGTLFVVLFSFKTERIRKALPDAAVLDGLMYKLAGVTFAGLALLLITGAVWANESWGRYWGWDAKEVGALVAWLTYAGFLHTRIARGWKGRRSAYFALVAFLFVIFTYLGVSYLLPGLHSYA